MPPMRGRPLAAGAPYLSDLRPGCFTVASRVPFDEAEGFMDGLAVADLKGVLAPLNFTQPMAEKPYSYNYEPPSGVPPRNTREEAHQVKILDGRAVNDRLSLEGEGFVLLRHPTAAADLYDEAEIARIYYPECERLVREATGAKRVVAFDHIVRNAALMAKGNAIKQPAGRVHNDYTTRSAPQRVRDLMGDEAEALLKRRFAEINVWRPIRGPLLRSPLACATRRPCPRKTSSPPICAIPTAPARPTR